MMVRVKFAKYGPLRFTGHLDVLRFFQKAIRRAGLDVVYTHGFNPHQVMSFAAPLGVGLCSVGEYMDVEIASSDGAEDFKERLQEACPYGIDIRSFHATIFSSFVLILLFQIVFVPKLCSLCKEKCRHLGTGRKLLRFQKRFYFLPAVKTCGNFFIVRRMV